ncbi:MAG: hypothetical protein WC598_03100 [Methanoregula sp.]
MKKHERDIIFKMTGDLTPIKKIRVGLDPKKIIFSKLDHCPIGIERRPSVLNEQIDFLFFAIIPIV